MSYRILFILFFTFGIIQAQKLEREKIYDFTIPHAYLMSFDTTSDGGYIAQAAQNALDITFPGINMKLSALGDTIWTIQTGTKVSNYDRSACGNLGKSYLFASILPKYSTNADTALLVVNKYGTDKSLIYTKQYTIDQNRNSFVPTSILINNPNDYWFFGWSANTKLTVGQGGSWKFTIIQTDSLGNRTREKVYYPGWIGSGGRTCNITKYGSGNYVMYGFNATCCERKPFLMKIQLNMDTVATATTYLSSTNDIFDPEHGNLIYSRSNYFYISGNYFSSNLDLGQSIVQKIDTSLNVIWTKKLGVPGTYTNRIFELANDTILLVSPQNFTNKIWLFKITKDGKIVDSTFITSTIGGLGEMYEAKLRWDGKLAIAGEAMKTDFNLTGKAYFALIQMPYATRPAGYNICSLFKPSSVFTEYQSKDTLYLSPQTSTLTGYSWTFCNTASTSQKAFCKISQPDSVEVKLIVTNNMGCRDTTIRKVDVNYSFTGINSSLIQNALKVFPNPTHGELTIETTKEGIFYLYDLQNKLMMEIETKSGVQNIDPRNLNSGIYLYRFTTEEFTERGKIVKE